MGIVSTTYCRPMLAFFVILLTLAASAGAQLKSARGILGGEFERQGYFYPTTQSVFSRYRQIASFELVGFLYNPNLLEFHLQSRIMNTSSLIATLATKARQHDVCFDLYDFSASLLQRTPFPISVHAKRNLSTIELKNGFIPTFYNEIMTQAMSLRWSPAISPRLPRMTFLYDRYDSKGLNPLAPLDQRNQNIQLTFDMSGRNNSEVSLDLLQRTRQDNVSHVRFVTQEVHFRGFSRPNELHQISTNANFWNENRISSLDAIVFWNSQYAGNLTNQLIGQFRLFNTPFARNIEGELRNQLNIALSAQWRGLLIVSHSEGRSGSPGEYSPIRATAATAGVTYQGEFEHLQTTLMSQGTYRRSQGPVTKQSLESIISGSIRTKGFAVVQVSLGDQLNMRRWWGFASRALLQNVATATVESNA
ncbi:MAG: hypothetical protein ACP5ON_11515, partial [Bacteroidota bacterium]